MSSELRLQISRRGLLLVAAVAAVVIGLSSYLASDDASGAVEGRQIIRYDVTVDLAASGTAEVTIDMDFDFGAEPGHGPFITLPTRQGYDDERDRRFLVSAVQASSSTGAPARRYLSFERNEVRIRVGDENRGDIHGVHQYTITYRLDGMVNPQWMTGELDEFYWNAIGDAWEIPLSDVTVTVRGPADAVAAGCFAGDAGSTDACADASRTGTVATFAHPRLEPGQPFTVVVGWPGGTFPHPTVDLVPREQRLAAFSPLNPLGGLAAVIALVGLVGVPLLARRRGRDRVYVGVTPGLVPGAHEEAQVTRRGKVPVAVQFTPPRGVPPGLVGTLVYGSADPHDVTATIVDLAVRGYLRIEEVDEDQRWGNDGPEWRLVKLREPDVSLEPYEASIMGGLFRTSDRVRLDSLRLAFAGTMTQVQRELDDAVVERGWYRKSPATTRAVWRTVGRVLAVVGGLGVFAVLSTTQFPAGSLWLCAAVTVVGISTRANAKHATARTAEGSAVLTQVEGFRRYIATAEANQLRWEERGDIFSRYLPYAIVFEETDRWARIFADLARDGRAPDMTTWYAGAPTAGALAVGTVTLGSALSSFTAAASSAFSPPRTSGSSGSSGFSGGSSGGSSGGGSAGGGGGGGGGGGW